MPERMNDANYLFILNKAAGFLLNLTEFLEHEIELFGDRSNNGPRIRSIASILVTASKLLDQTATARENFISHGLTTLPLGLRRRRLN
jgi:hypothetical protein